MKEKVFCIGFHKTGTTSLGRALEILGYRNSHGAGVLRQRLGNQRFMDHLSQNKLEPFFDYTKEYDSFNDNPWYLIYSQLLERFPEARYILSIRDDDKWLKSAQRFFGHSQNPIRQYIYGQDMINGNEELYLKRYQRHNSEVQKLFFDKGNDLLVVDIDENEKWKKLCSFLDCTVPNTQFPHENRFMSNL